MSRLKSVRDSWKEATERLMHDKQEFAHFLRFAARMYKQSFSDAVLIYNQDPGATKVATLETWNRLGRIVNRGEHSIAVFGEEDKCKHLFDITQTSGKRIPELWHLDDSLASEVTAAINEKYGKRCKNIQETIAAVSVDNIKPLMADVEHAVGQMNLSETEISDYQRSLVSAVRFTISNRCELGGDMKISGGINLNAADMFKNSRDFIRFCDIVQRASKSALLEIEREIVQIRKRKKEYTYERQNERDRAVSDTDRVHGRQTGSGAASQADRQMGQNVAGMGENRVPDGSAGVYNGRSVADNSPSDRQRSGDEVLGTGRTVSQGQSPSGNVRGDTGVGKNAPAEHRTSDNGRNGILPSDITVKKLKEMYLHSDFNRRLDSYEIAGMVLGDSEGAKITPVEWFDKFFADRYSALQGEEIRTILETALRNRDIERGKEQPVKVVELPNADSEISVEPERTEEKAESQEEADERLISDVDDMEPEEDTEHTVINNSMILTSDIPPMTDEQLIREILRNDRFFHTKKDEITEFFLENSDSDKRAEYMKTAVNPEYCELDIGDKRVGYKAFADGIVVWEGSYLSRTKEAGLSWDLVQSLTADMIRKNEYLDLDSEQQTKSRSTRSAQNKESPDKLIIYSFRFDEAEDVTVASCELGGKRFETAVERTAEGIPYITDGKKPYKLNDYQTYDLEQFELYRSPIVHDKNGYYADDLDEGDNIRLDGEMWRVEKKTDNMIHLSRETDEGILDKNIYDNWQEALTQQGFEYIPDKAPVIDVPAPAKKKQTARKSKPTPVSGGEQLSFFGEPVEIAAPAKPKKRDKLRLIYPATNVTQDMIDYALRGGSGKPQSLERIAYQFQLGKTDAENAEFLRKEFGTDGRGFYLPDETQLSVWFDKDGITLGAGVTAFNIVTKEHITWEDAAKRIGEMLANGEYCSQDIIDRSPQNEINDLAAQLWYIHQDIDRDSGIEYFIPEEMFRGGYPDSHNRIMADIADPETLSKYISGMEDFIRRYEENPDIMRFRFHKPKEALFRLKDLQRRRTEFLTNSNFEYLPKLFITEDEKDKLLLEHYGYRYGKFSIAKYFEQHEDQKERIAFLKQQFGEGGSSSMGFDESHNSKGMRYVKTDFSLGKVYCNTEMKWNEVAERIERLIAEGKYITQAEIDERIKDAKRDLERCDPTDFLEQYAFEQAKKVLDEYGIDYSDIIAKKGLAAETDEPVQEEPEQEVTETAEKEQEEEPETPDAAEIEQATEPPAPVQAAAAEIQQRSAIFMDINDESFVYVANTVDGVEYAMYAPDLMVIDGGIMENMNTADLRFAASQVIGTEQKNLAEIRDTELFSELSELEYEGDVPTRLAELKADALNNMPDSIETPETEFSAEVEEEAAVFMDIRDETFISVMQVDEGIEYTVYAADLTPIDGGVWEMDEAMELKTAATLMLETEEHNLVEIEDYDRFFEIADMNTDLDVPAELAIIKSGIMAKIPERNYEPTILESAPAKEDAPADDKPAVNAPEKIQITTKKEPKTGTPVTYHFRERDIVQGGAKSKFKANVEAIRLLQKIESENRYATPEEQSVLAGYVGWGGIPQAFTSDRAADSFAGNLGEAAPSGWETEQQELRELLTPEEYKAARASTLTSFYTPPEITDGIYQALEQFGFEGGNVLEPSMGVGNFFAKMPEEMRSNSRLYGVELDSISGRIAQQLYPQERIQIKGFEQTSFNNNSFDVVVGNIPFGDYRVSDKAYDKLGFKIHDYFAAKAVDKVKPGGVVAIVTSKFTMDKMNDKARRYLAERCDLLGAIRLPNDAFKKNAGTETTSDILFFKKRDTLTVEVPTWVHMGQTTDGIPCNQYFVDNPDMMLGTMAWDERMKGKYGDDSKVTACYGNSDTSLSEQIKAAIAKIKGAIETTRAEEQEQGEISVIPADPSVRNFTHTIVDGKLYFRENEIMTEVQETGKTLERMVGLHNIRQAAMAVIDAQAALCSDEELERLQLELNIEYDRFVKKYGYITDPVNERCFRQDDDYNTLAALEIIDVEKKTVEKSEIFSKRTILPEVEITRVDTPQEALQVSLDRLGKVDIAYMAKLMDCTAEKLIEGLGNDVFRDPAKIKDDEPLSGYVDASEYLSGNVREKLKIAQRYAEHIDSGFQKNVDALTKVIPKDLEASEISVRIGANWIDVEDYNQFLSDYAKADTGPFGHPVTRTRMGEYKIEGKYVDKRVSANETYGTSRMSSYHIFENLLNQRDIVIRDSVKDDDGKTTYVINPTETQLAKEKARLMKEAFKSWIWEDIDRRQKYVERYNYLFNGIRGREYDGSHQSFTGMNPAIKLRPHQENAVLRAKLSGNTLLAHCVGAGKSFEMIAATMEKKRLGLINKGCIVVPKHLTLQTASEWLRLYPNAKLLVARPEDFTKDNRQKFIARCVTGDYDAVIMSFQQFERIPMSFEYRRQFMESELNEIMDALQDTDDGDRASVKALERQQKRIQEQLEKLMSSPKDNSLCFEKLGFDYLVCDEAHNYKNCFVATKMSNVAGVQTTAAQKSEDMLMKTQYLNDKYGCNNILFSTGTPVSNSMVEFYVMQRYLRPDLLEKAGLETFDDWASTFGEVVSQLEIKPAGDGFQMKNRFSKFVNIPELMQMYKEFADIQTPDMVKLKVPELTTGKPIIVSSKPDEFQKMYMQELAKRSEAIHSGCVDPREDNMLRITHEARLLGLDCRCLNPNAIPAPDSKVNKLLENLEKLYHQTEKEKGVQIVFCDIAVNEDAQHFSIYQAIKDELIKRGIPREEICFAGDAKTDKARADMYEQLRKGEKRFILASTSKLGTGANIQDRICAIHHLDIPWKPADLTQQDGRGVRQGNNFSEISIYHYLTEETFDAYLMGIITNKAKFISQIMTSKEPARVSEDVDETVLTYSEMQAIASGNPMIKEKIQLDNDVAMLKTLRSEHKKSVYKMQELAERVLPQRIEQLTTLVHKASNDLKAYQEHHPDKAEFALTINGKIYTERKEAGEILDKAIIKCATTGEQQHLGNYFGFDVTIEKKLVSSSDETCCVAVLNGELKYSTEVTMANALGNIRRLEILADTSINKQIQQYSEQLEQAKANLEEARTAVTKPFEREEELEKKQARLDFVNAALSGGKTEDPEPILIDEPSASERDTKSAAVEPTSVIMTVKMPAAMTAPAFDRPQLKPVPPPAATKEPQRTVSHKTRR